MNTALIAAAGSGTRMKSETPKVLLPLLGRPALFYCLQAFDASRSIGQITLVCPRGMTAVFREAAGQLGLAKPLTFAEGGDTRTQSVLNGLRASRKAEGLVFVHDAARPMITPGVIDDMAAFALARGSAVAGAPARNTIKQADASGRITASPDRNSLFEVYTPQVFDFHALLAAYEKAANEGYVPTDDAAVMARAGFDSHIYELPWQDIKLTTPEDMTKLEAVLAQRQGTRLRCGTGFDTHRLTEGRPLILGGIEIPFEKGLLGHSDADVLTHAVMDALLGACNLGDIGRWFPDTDPKYKGVRSVLLLHEVGQKVKEAGYGIVNIDTTVICERPKIAPVAARMSAAIAEALGIPAESVSVKGTTTEGMNAEGRGEAISVQAVASVARAF